MAIGVANGVFFANYKFRAVKAKADITAVWDNTETDPDIDVTGDFTSYYSKIKLVGLSDAGAEITEFATYDSPVITGNTDGTSGQVMVKLPPLWVHRSYDVNGALTGYSLSDYEKSGYTLHPAFWDYDEADGVLGRDAVYIGAYEATGNTSLIASVSGIVPLMTIRMDQFRTAAAARGTGWHILDFWTEDLIELLFYAYYGTRDSQTALPGFTERTAFNTAYMRTTGRSDILTTVNGSIDADTTGLDADIATGWKTEGRGTAVANRFLFIENIFGHIWKLNDGVAFDGRVGEKKTVWHTPDPRKFTSVDATVLATYRDMNVDLLAVDTGTYIGTVGDGFVPLAALTANSEKFWCDLFYSYLTDAANRDYLRSVRAGGGLSYGANAGLAARIANDYLASTSSGARLMYKPNL